MIIEDDKIYDVLSNGVAKIFKKYTKSVNLAVDGNVLQIHILDQNNDITSYAGSIIIYINGVASEVPINDGVGFLEINLQAQEIVIETMVVNMNNGSLVIPA